MMTILGAFLYAMNTSFAIIIIIIGAFLGGINIITIWAVRLIHKDLGQMNAEVKEDYKNLDWLRYQYHDLGKSIQDIAHDQGVSMITIKEWLEKIGET